MPFDFSSVMPMLHSMFGGAPGSHAGPFRPSANLGQQRGPGGEQLPPLHSKLTRPQGYGGMGSLLAALPTILSAAPDIFKAITGDPGYQARMKQNKQNQQATPSATASTTPSATPSTPPPSTTIPPVAPTPSVTPTTSATTTPSSTSSSGGYIPSPTPLLDTGRTYSGQQQQQRQPWDQQQQQPPAIGSPGYFNPGSGRVNMPHLPGDTGGPMNMPTRPGDLGGSEAY